MFPVSSTPPSRGCFGQPSFVLFAALRLASLRPKADRRSLLSWPSETLDDPESSATIAVATNATWCHYIACIASRRVMSAHLQLAANDWFDCAELEDAVRTKELTCAFVAEGRSMVFEVESNHSLLLPLIGPSNETNQSTNVRSWRHIRSKFDHGTHLYADAMLPQCWWRRQCLSRKESNIWPMKSPEFVVQNSMHFDVVS